MGYTKGKWKAIEYSIKTKIGYSTHEIQYGNDGECVAEVVHGEYNAKLISAAPELLEALNELYEASNFDVYEDSQRLRRKCENAIKKATE